MVNSVLAGVRRLKTVWFRAECGAGREGDTVPAVRSGCAEADAVDLVEDGDEDHGDSL